MPEAQICLCMMHKFLYFYEMHLDSICPDLSRLSEEVIEAYNNLLKNVFRSHTLRGDDTKLLETLHGWLFAYGDVAIAQHRGYKEIKKQEPPARVKYLFREFKNTKRKRRIG